MERRRDFSTGYRMTRTMETAVRVLYNVWVGQSWVGALVAEGGDGLVGRWVNHSRPV